MTDLPKAVADLSHHLSFDLTDDTATVFFMLGAAAMVFTTSFFGFFSSRRRLVKPLAMVYSYKKDSHSVVAHRPWLLFKAAMIF